MCEANKQNFPPVCHFQCIVIYARYCYAYFCPNLPMLCSLYIFGLWPFLISGCFP